MTRKKLLAELHFTHEDVVDLQTLAIQDEGYIPELNCAYGYLKDCQYEFKNKMYSK